MKIEEGNRVINLYYGRGVVVKASRDTDNSVCLVVFDDLHSCLSNLRNENLPLNRCGWVYTKYLKKEGNI